MSRKYIMRDLWYFPSGVFMANKDIQNYLQIHPSGIEFIAPTDGELDSKMYALRIV
jgi:hypothetical protein